MAEQSSARPLSYWMYQVEQAARAERKKLSEERIRLLAEQAADEEKHLLSLGIHPGEVTTEVLRVILRQMM